ncbi:MAG: hypothetical protein JWN27_3802 [Candidatus Eremiobacteraeota bacterium]|nr:hypothetical protein [Candidatus Eremiobacteraeota bacterium]
MSGRAEDQTAAASLRAMLEDAERAWNTGDARRYGEFFAEDATYVGRAGHIFAGRAAIRDGHVEAFAGPFRGSRLKIRPSHVRFINESLAIAHLDLVTVQADGTDIHAVTTGLLERTAAGWHLLTAHTTQVG